FSRSESRFLPHCRLGLQGDVGEEWPDQGECGGGPVANGLGDGARGLVPAGLDVEAGRRQAAAGQGGRAGRTLRPVDGGPPGGLAGGVHDEDVVAHDQPDLRQPEEEQEDERQHERELDRRLSPLVTASLLAGPAGRCHPFTWPSRVSKIPSKRSPILLVCVAQLTMSRATAATPRSTRAYSAVAWPRWSRRSRLIGLTGRVTRCCKTRFPRLNMAFPSWEPVTGGAAS